MSEWIRNCVRREHALLKGAKAAKRAKAKRWTDMVLTWAGNFSVDADSCLRDVFAKARPPA
jgi:hypothetical protein